MSCPWEEQIAMYVGDDLKFSQIAMHLSTCKPCRSLLENLQLDRNALAGVDVISAEVIEGLRHTVLDSVRSRSLGHLKVGVAVAASIAFAVGTAGWFTQVRGIAPSPVAVTREAGPKQTAFEVQPNKHPVRTRRHSGSFKRRSEPAPNPALDLALEQFYKSEKPQSLASSSAVALQIVTEDPNVVFLIVPEIKGQKL